MSGKTEILLQPAAEVPLAGRLGHRALVAVRRQEPADPPRPRRPAHRQGVHRGRPGGPRLRADVRHPDVAGADAGGGVRAAEGVRLRPGADQTAPEWTRVHAGAVPGCSSIQILNIVNTTNFAALGWVGLVLCDFHGGHHAGQHGDFVQPHLGRDASRATCCGRRRTTSA